MTAVTNHYSYADFTDYEDVYFSRPAPMKRRRKSFVKMKSEDVDFARKDKSQRQKTARRLDS